MLAAAILIEDISAFKLIMIFVPVSHLRPLGTEYSIWEETVIRYALFRGHPEIWQAQDDAGWSIEAKWDSYLRQVDQLVARIGLDAPLGLVLSSIFLNQAISGGMLESPRVILFEDIRETLRPLKWS